MLKSGDANGCAGYPPAGGGWRNTFAHSGLLWAFVVVAQEGAQLPSKQHGAGSSPVGDLTRKKGGRFLVANNEKTTRRQGNNGNGFRPGQSGNPAGRPRKTPEQKDALAAIRDLAPNAASVLQQIMQDPSAPAAARIRAAVEILDRTYGKAETPIKVDDEKRDTLSDIRRDVAKIKEGIHCE